ncbi:MAG: hypothetical protein CSB44_03390 [Gammaproteobacteria bacterium]|nr:MAG: hypothetical protein CSB44_03390 [Gammaproteobacteria bacterium]
MKYRKLISDMELAVKQLQGQVDDEYEHRQFNKLRRALRKKRAKYKRRLADPNLEKDRLKRTHKRLEVVDEQIGILDRLLRQRRFPRKG